MLILFVGSTFKPIVPFVDYAINKDFIATVLCINKDKPEMHCDGKCHLTKETKKSNDNNKKNTLLDVKDITLFLNKVQVLLPKKMTVSTYNKPNLYVLDVYKFLSSCYFFHPPRLF